MIEGRPLEPFLKVAPTLSDIREGKDTILNAAAKALLKELNPGGFGFTGGDALANFELPASESLINTIKEKAFEWGSKPTPDWAIDAKIRALQLGKVGKQR